MLKVVTNLGSKKLEREIERLQDEVVTLKKAIVEAINKGQKSLADLNDISGSGPVSNKKSALTCADAGSGVAGWIDDLRRRAAGHSQGHCQRQIVGKPDT
jgi:hypothetical protein